MRVILAGMFAVFLCASAFAQSPNGSIGGIVFDPDAKTIPGAQIIVVNDLTRVQYETKCNDSGIYVVPNLPPGPYRVQASKAGFKTLIKPDIILNVQDAITVNFTLPIGAASITLTVEGGAPMINTTDASVSTVVDREFAENLPLNGRSFQTLIYLTPGVVVTPTNQADNGQFSVNGQRAASNYWMVDGVSANVGIGAGVVPGNGVGGALGSFSALGGTNSLVSVDAMQEFRIQTSTFAPEFGRTPGAQISIVSRSGTNQLHGTAFDYLRNDILDANNWFADSAGLEKPRERQNDFGGTVAGPILRDRMFFFFSYEGLRLRLPATTLSEVPDLAARQNAVQAVQPFLNAYPLPNGADNPATGVAQFNASYSNPASLDAYSLRIDRRLGDRWTLFGRYNYSPSEFVARGGSTQASPLSDVQPTRITTQTATLGATRTVSPVASNDLRFNYSHTSARSNYFLDDFGGAVPIANLPFPSGHTSQDGLFALSMLSLQGSTFMPVGRWSSNIQRQVNVVDGVSWQNGPHSLKFGVDFRRLHPTSDAHAYQQQVFFSKVPQAEAGKALTGRISSFSEASLLFRNLGLFAQDTWRVRPRLTLTYGLRWDVDFTPASESGPNIAAVTGYNLTDLSHLAVAPPGTQAFQTTYSNVAPRVGLAYQLSPRQNWQTVLRAGFGVFYDLASSEVGNVLGVAAPPFSNFRLLRHAAFPFTESQIAPVPIPSTGLLSNLFSFNPNLRLPYTLEWNVALEQSIGENQSISATYIGARGSRLLQTTQIVNPPSNPQLSAFFIDNTSSSNYNALQLQFRRRLDRGLQVLASYTFSHSIDNASAGSYGTGSNSGFPGAGDENRGSSDFDIRHSLSLGLTYDLPGPKKNFLAKAILGGWSTENFLLARSAPPVDLIDENFFEFNGGVVANIRPDLVPGQALYLYGPQYPGGKAFNPAGFTDPPADPSTGNSSRQGNLGRNTLRGFGATQWDFAIHRDFPVHESFRMEFRAELFNVLNHPNFGAPNNEFGTGGFGLSTQSLSQSLSAVGSAGAGGFNALYQIGGPRSVQLGLKFLF